MSELELLFLVLAVIYGWECAWWLPRNSVAFRTWLGRSWHAAQPGSLLGNQRGGFVFGHPLPPLGSLLAGTQFPLSLSPDAVLAYVAASVSPSGRPPQTGKLFRFDDIREVRAAGRKVKVNGELLLKAASPTHAAHVAHQIRELLKQSPADRDRAIKELARAAFDVRAIERRWQDFQNQSTKLRWVTNGLFVFLFLGAPLLIWHFGLHHSWLGLLLGLLALSGTAAFHFRRIHQAFYPAAEDERFTHFLTVLLSPATTIRARDIAARPLLEHFHPLALAEAFCPEEDFRALARRFLRDLRHPALPLCPRPEPEAVTAERHWREVLQAASEQFLRKSGLSPDELVKSPPPAEASCRSYCPRCLTQFTAPAGVCDDCGGLALEPFPVATAPKRG